jgi:hypothetical protein
MPREIRVLLADHGAALEKRDWGAVSAAAVTRTSFTSNRTDAEATACLSWGNSASFLAINLDISQYLAPLHLI